MMYKRKFDFNWVLLAVAIVLAGVAAWATKNYFVVKEHELVERLSRSNVVMAEVVVASQNLGVGDLVSPANMTVRRIEADLVPLDAIHPSQFQAADGLHLLQPMAPGRPLLRSYLPESKADRFSDLLAEGRRAVTVRIDEVNSSAGMLQPNDNIDLFLLFNAGDRTSAQRRLELVLEGAVVLATGTRTTEHLPYETYDFLDQVARYSTVTLDLSIEDALRVRMAEEKGRFVTLLRNSKEELAVQRRSLDEAELFASALSESGASPVREVEIIIGGKKSEVQTYLPEELQNFLNTLEN